MRNTQHTARVYTHSPPSLHCPHARPSRPLPFGNSTFGTPRHATPLMHVMQVMEQQKVMQERMEEERRNWERRTNHLFHQYFVPQHQLLAQLTSEVRHLQIQVPAQRGTEGAW